MKVKFHWIERHHWKDPLWKTWIDDDKYQVFNEYFADYFELEFADEEEITLIMLKYTFLRLYK